MIKFLYGILGYLGGALTYAVILDSSDLVRTWAVIVVGTVSIGILVFLANSSEASQ